MDEDRDIIERVKHGDYDAFETLVEKYSGRVFRHLRKMVNDSSHAEDLLQETFLNAYRGLDSFEGGSTFSTWLFRIATNTGLMYLRKRRPETLEYDDAIGDQANTQFSPISPRLVNTPLEMLLSMEGRRELERAIDRLPVNYRTVLVLRDVEGFSLQEVSKIVDSSLAAVKSRLHRARNSVRDALNSYYVERVTPSQESASR